MRPNRIILKHNAQPFEVASMKYYIWKTYRPYRIDHRVVYDHIKRKYVYLFDMKY